MRVPLIRSAAVTLVVFFLPALASAQGIIMPGAAP